MTKDEKIAYAKKYHTFNSKIEKYGRKIFFKALKEQTSSLLDYLKRGGQLYESIVDIFITPDTIKQALSGFYRSVSPKFLSFFQQPLQPTPSSILSFRDAQKLAELSRIAESAEVLQKVTNITDTTRRIIKETISNGFLQGKPQREIIKEINTKTKGQIILKRATLIARTESTYISSKAAEVNVMFSPFAMQKEWIPIVDMKTRDTHLHMLSKKPVPKEQPFNVGGVPMKYPGDPAGGAANCCNCRCCIVFSPITQDETLSTETTEGNILVNQIVENLLR